MTRRLLHRLRRPPDRPFDPGDRAEAARPGGVAARWRCLTIDPATGRRFRSTNLLDGLALAMDDVLAGREPAEGWLLRGPILGDDPADCRAVGAAAAAAARRGIATGVPDDRETALLLWLVKYADVGVPEPATTIYPSRAERRRARSRLRRLLPDLGGPPGDPTAERLLDLLREARPSAAALGAIAAGGG
jgi:hypothetical protein